MAFSWVSCIFVVVSCVNVEGTIPQEGINLLQSVEQEGNDGDVAEENALLEWLFQAEGAVVPQSLGNGWKVQEGRVIFGKDAFELLLNLLRRPHGKQLLLCCAKLAFGLEQLLFLQRDQNSSGQLELLFLRQTGRGDIFHEAVLAE